MAVISNDVGSNCENQNQKISFGKPRNHQDFVKTRSDVIQRTANQNRQPYFRKPRNLLDLKTRSYVIHKNDTSASTNLLKQYKSVETAFSYTDLLSLKKLANEMKYRKTKSQESLTKSRKNDSDWLPEDKMNIWAEKLKRLAEKLNQPGGEDKLKKKIDRCIKKMPNPISADNNESLSEQILDKLKRMCSKSDKLEPKKYKEEFIDKSVLKRHIELWLKALPIIKRDNAKFAKRDVILESILNRLEPFLRKPQSLLEFQKVLNTNLIEIMYDVPFEPDHRINEEHVKTFTDKIVYEMADKFKKKVPPIEDKKVPVFEENNAFIIEDKKMPNIDFHSLEKNKSSAVKPLKIEEKKAIEKRQPTEKDIKDFVTDEITYFLEGTELTLSESSMNWIERELTDILMEALMYGFDSDESLKEDIDMVLQDVGNFTEFQAEVFTRKLRKRFRSTFQVVKKTESGLPTFFSYPKNFFVYYNNTQDNQTAEKYFCANTKNYFEQLTKVIEEWIQKSNFVDRFTNETSKHFAVTHLVENIIKRHKYLERHPSRKRPDNDETEFLNFQVRKWVRKFLGDKNDIMIKVPRLTAMLKDIPVPLLTTVQEIVKLSPYRNAELLDRNYIPNSKYRKAVYEEIYDWYQDLHDDLCYIDDKKSSKLFIRMLADNIERSIKENSDKDIRNLISKEVEYWVLRVLKCSPRIFLVEDLKNRISKVPLDFEREKDIVKTQTIATGTNVNNIDAGVDGKTCDMYSEYDMYFKQVTKEIDEWLAEFVPEAKENVSRKFAIYDLATDIVDRQKYLKINPSSYVSEYEELETLKYQIFKWINKTIGENNLATIMYASNLRDRIQAITVPIPQSSIYDIATQTYCRNNVSHPIRNTDHSNTRNKNINRYEMFITDPSSGTSKDKTSIETPMNFRNYFSIQSNVQTDKYKITQVRADCSIQSKSLNTSSMRTSFIPFVYGSTDTTDQEITTSSCSNVKKRASVKFSDLDQRKAEGNKLAVNNRASIFNVNIELTNTRFKKPDLDMDDEVSIPHNLPLSKAYEYFETILKNRCDELPLETNTPEQKHCAEISRQGIYNGIWKTYFRLKSDPNVDHDYILFEAMLEDKLDAMLDVLPQTAELQSMRQRWKTKVLVDVTQLLEYVHSITDSPSFRTILANNFSRSFCKAKNKELNDKLKQLFVTETVDAFILHSRYKNEDPLKANVYKQRLMKKLGELCENIKSEYPDDFRNVSVNQLCQEAFKILGNVGLPEDEMLKDEAEEILLGDEVEQWCTELPSKANRTVVDDIVRNRCKDILVKRLYELEKRAEEGDSNVEEEMRCEIGEFLSKYADIDTTDQHNVNLHTDVLINRLNSRKQAGFNSFQQSERGPANLVEPDPGSIMAPLIDSKPQSRQSIVLQSTRSSQANAPILYAEQNVGTSKEKRPTGHTEIATFADQATEPNCQTLCQTVSNFTDPIAEHQLPNHAYQQPVFTAPVVGQFAQHYIPPNQYQYVPEGPYPQVEPTAFDPYNNTLNEETVKTGVIGTNTQDLDEFEVMNCPCLEFYRGRQKKRSYYEDDGPCICVSANCGFPMY